MENVNPVKELLREKYFRETGPPEGIFQEKKLNLCLCFRLGTAPRILTKHPKIPISLMGGGGGGAMEEVLLGRTQLSSYFKT